MSTLFEKRKQFWSSFLPTVFFIVLHPNQWIVCFLPVCCEAENVIDTSVPIPDPKAIVIDTSEIPLDHVADAEKESS